MDTIDAIIRRVIRREGGLSDHPDDRGGLTKYGITYQTFKYHYPRGTEDDLRELTKEQAIAIYRKQYWEDPGFDQLDLCLDCADLLLDTAVHSGPTRAIKLLQLAVGVTSDGHIGPVTRDAVARFDGPFLLALLLAERLSFLGRLITMDKSQAAFASGWINRMREFLLVIPFMKKEDI